MLGYGFWQREYAGDPGVIGSQIRLNGYAYTVVGVAPEDYPGIIPGVPADFMVPVAMAQTIQQDGGNALESRSSYSYFTRGRLRPGATLEGARVALAGLTQSFQETFPDEWDENQAFTVVPTEDVVMNPVLDPFLVSGGLLALVLVGVVLLIACANLAAFLLARGADRRKEIAMRLALGARRSVLVRQLMTETFAIALLGGILGMGVSLALIRLLVSMELPLPGGIHLEVALTGKAFFFGLGVTALAGLLFGLTPALQSTNPDVAPTLKDESAGGGGARRFTLRNLLVAGQVAASVVLLVSAGLFLRSLQAFEGEDPGFGMEPSALLTFVLSSERYDESEGRALVREYLDALRQDPAVSAAGITSNIHLNTTNISTLDVNVAGVEPPPGRDDWPIDHATVGPGFFQAAGIPILRGRNFEETDLPDGTPVAVINEVMAQRFWPGEDAVGKVIRSNDGREMTVVGIARTTKVRTLGESPRPFIYRSWTQRYTPFLTAVVQTRGSAAEILQVAFRTMRELDPEMVVVETKTVEEHFGVMLLPARLGSLLSALFAVVALALAAIGLYGVVSYAVARRTREVGIRMSLGADAGQVVRQMVREGMGLAGTGVLVGLALAFLGARILRSLLFQVQATDPLTFLVGPAILLGLALLSSWLPARRASRVDPVRALKAD
jgi:predicted permease